MKDIIKRNFLLRIYFATLLAILGSASCSPRPEPIVLDSATVLTQSIQTTELTDNQFNTSRMKIGKMVPYDFYLSINANGMFEVPPENVTSVGTFFGGYVKEFTLLPGQSVRKGQMLMLLENPEFIQMQQDFLEAKGQLEYLKSDFERQKVLVADNVTSQKKYLKAESDYKVLAAKFESLKMKLDLININTSTLTDENIKSTIAILSPMDGFVTHINVTKGMYLTPTFDALTITNTSHLHLELSIFERDLQYVEIGQLIKFKTQNDPKEYEARVFLINKSVNEERRTISVHGDLIDEENIKQFAPGMYVEAQILTSTKNAHSLPQEAVVNIDEKYFVLEKKELDSGITEFVRREVEPGISINGYVEILNYKEFDKDTEFLVKGAFNLIKD